MKVYGTAEGGDTLSAQSIISVLGSRQSILDQLIKVHIYKGLKIFHRWISLTTN